ncbi:NAD-P-binding protein [Mycena polygramma]|nr:NAD-P-binding protein [Mycena polygramma]
MDEEFPNSTYQKEIYSLIDPATHYEAQTHKGNVVFITGASRGIGAETALYYARAGAAVVLAARYLDTLDGVKSVILEQVPEAKVLVLAVDVTKTRDVEEAISTTISEFGRLDILIANAGKAGNWTRPLLEKDPDEWWSVVETTIRGVFNAIFFSIPHLLKTKGSVVVVSSRAAQVRIPGSGSDYAMAKHAVGRLVEQIHFEFPDIKIFSLHPGSVATEMGLSTKLGDPPTDSVGLSAATMLYLTAGNADWLVGRYVSANWDLGEIEEKWKAKVVDHGGLVSKLFIPV